MNAANGSTIRDEIQVVRQDDGSDDSEDSVTGEQVSFRFRGRSYRYGRHDCSGLVLFEDAPDGSGIWTGRGVQVRHLMDAAAPAWAGRHGFAVIPFEVDYNGHKLTCHRLQRPTHADALALLDNLDTLQRMLYRTPATEDVTPYHKDPETYGW